MPPAHDSTPRVTGTCEVLEREYLRTAPTDAAAIRPRHVIVEALEYVLARADGRDRDQGRGNTRRIPAEMRYAYLSSQLKGLRQDLTAQGIADAVAIDVYAAHAREALAAADRGEFVACHGRLKELHEADMANDADSRTSALAALHRGQRVLFEVMMGGYEEKELAAELLALIEGARAEVSAHSEASGAAPKHHRAVLSFIAAHGEGNAARLWAAFDGLSPPLRLVVTTFAGPLRTRLLENLLAASGPAKVPAAAAARHLLCPTAEDLRTFVAAVTGVSLDDGQALEAKKLLAAFYDKRASLRRHD